MGSFFSRYKQLPGDLLEDYAALTPFTRNQIRRLHALFYMMEPKLLGKDQFARIPGRKVMKFIPQFKVNPFQDRLVHVFSSKCDGNMSFEDCLDLMSALHQDTPFETKAAWAFRILDFDGDNCLGEQDLNLILERITGEHLNKKRRLTPEQKKEAVKKILSEADIDNTGVVCFQEFVHLLSKSSDFSASFTIKI